MSISRHVAAGIIAACGFGTAARADVFNVTVTPGSVPDAQPPRIAPDAPTGFGADSWMNSSTGKVNVYVTPQQLFGRNVTIGEIESISYWTKAPAGHENWYVNIYTAPHAGGDQPWYGQRFFNDGYTSYPSDGAWHQNNVTMIERSSGALAGTEQTLADWKSQYGNLPILAFSPQTNSGIPLGSRDAQIDGLTITLANGDVGNVDFASAVPLPSVAGAAMAVMGLMAVNRPSRRAKA